MIQLPIPMTSINSAQYLSLRIADLSASRVDTAVPTSLSSAPVARGVSTDVTVGNYSKLLLRDTVSQSVEVVGAIQVTQGDLDTVANFLTDIKTRRDLQAAMATDDPSYQTLTTEIHDLEVNLSGYLGSRSNGMQDLVSRYSQTQQLTEKYFEAVDATTLPFGLSESQVGAVEIDVGAYLGSIHDASSCPLCNPAVNVPAENAASTNYASSVTGATVSNASNVSYIEPLRMGNAWSLSAGETLSYSYYNTANPVPYSGYPSGSGINPPAVATPILGYATQIDTVFNLWDEVSSGLTFERVTERGSTVGELRLAYTDSVEKPAGSAAFAYGPGNSPINGDIWFDRTQTSNQSFAVGSYGYLTALHEIGHAIGLSHPFDGSSATGVNLNAANDSLRTTVMSYTNTDRNFVLNVSNSGGGLSANFNTRIYSSTPMVYDVAAIQYLYGSNNTTRAGDSTYSWQVTPKILETLVDSGGVDTIDASNQVHSSIINLNEGQYSSIGYWSQSEQLAYYDNLYGAGTGNWLQGYINSTNSAYNVSSVLYTGQDNVGIAYGAVIENAIGGVANDTLTGNAASNTLQGNAGNDTIDGGSGSDTAVFSGRKANYTIVQTVSGWTVTDNVGTDGTDTLTGIEYLSFSDMIFDPLGQVQYAQISKTPLPVTDGGSSKNLISSAAQQPSRLLQVKPLQTIKGDDKNNRMVGSKGSELLTAGAGNDWVDAGAGNDVIMGGAGNDIYLGGAGEDTVKFADAKAGIRVNLDAGYAGSLSGDNAAGIGVDAIAEIENIIGSRFDDVLTGDAADNKIAGFGGNDTIDGGDGVDTVVFAKSRNSYAIKKSGTGYTIKDGTSTTYVTRVESLEFLDGTFKLKTIAQANQQSAQSLAQSVDASLAKKALTVLTSAQANKLVVKPKDVATTANKATPVAAPSVAQAQSNAISTKQTVFAKVAATTPVALKVQAPLPAQATAKQTVAALTTDQGIAYVNRQRAALGAMTSVLEQRINAMSQLVSKASKPNANISVNNDAKATALLAKSAIIEQAGIAMLAAANTSSNQVMQLLK